MMIAANRSASYWLGLVQILASHQASWLRPLASTRLTAERRDLNALLRPMNCVHCCAKWETWLSREARILQSELSILDESLAQSFQQPDLSGSYRRRWRSKI